MSAHDYGRYTAFLHSSGMVSVGVWLDYRLILVIQGHTNLCPGQSKLKPISCIIRPGTTLICALGKASLNQ